MKAIDYQLVTFMYFIFPYCLLHLFRIYLYRACNERSKSKVFKSLQRSMVP